MFLGRELVKFRTDVRPDDQFVDVGCEKAIGEDLNAELLVDLILLYYAIHSVQSKVEHSEEQDLDLSEAERRSRMSYFVIGLHNR